LQYSFKNVATDQYVFEVCSPSPAYLNTTFSFTELNHFLISKSVVRVWDARRRRQRVCISSRLWGADVPAKGILSKKESNTYFLGISKKSSMATVMANEPKFQNWSSEDFYKYIIASKWLSTSGIMSEAYF
jgi:hypothetical protein